MDVPEVSGSSAPSSSLSGVRICNSSLAVTTRTYFSCA
jgi:hypothetical protein